MKNIFLIGFMGAGKSTISRALGEKLKFPVVEMDERIVREQGMSINDIFAKYGEAYFRDIESALVRTIGAEGGTVVSCGGGVVVRPENTESMKQSGTIVFLTASPETVYERVKNSTDRPILNGNMNVEFIAGLMEKRRALYEEAADIRVSTDGKSVGEITEELLGKLGKQYG